MTSPRRAVSSILLSALAFIASSLISPIRAYASTPTTTTLTVSSSCLSQGCAVTLTAKVAAGTTSVHPGLVSFCDQSESSCRGSLALGQAQITAAGTATFSHAFSPGTHNVYAIFSGTSTYAASTSSANTFTIAPPASYATINSLQATPVSASSPGQYMLEGIVESLGGPGPSGTMSYLDTTYGNALLGSSAFSGGVGYYDYASSRLDLSRIPASVLSDVLGSASGDVNNDGFNDIVLLGSHGIHVFLGSSTGTFTPAPSSSNVFGSSPGNVLVADFNSDGKLDIAVPDAATHAVHVSLGNGDGTFTDVSPTVLTNNPLALYLGDFNADGIPDVAMTVQNASTSAYAIQVAIGKGDGTFTPGETYLQGNATSAPVLVGDEDQDGRPDLIVADSGTYANQFQVLHNNGDGTFTPMTTTTRSTGAKLLAGGDFNGDGIQDFFVYDGSTLNLWLGVGDGTFVQPQSGYGNIYIYTLKIKGMFTGDFNHDGGLGLVIEADDTSYSPLQSFVNVYINSSSPQNGYYQFSPLDPLPIPTSSVGYTVAGDFNGDGTNDFIYFTPSTTPASADYEGYQLNFGYPFNAFTATLMPSGVHQVVASYSGDANNAASVSPPVALAGTGTLQVADPAGFPASSLALNGGSTIQNGILQLTDGGQFEARSAFFPNRVPVYSFDTTFEFQIPSSASDGLAFVIQSNGPNAIGSNGGGIGYGTPPGATTGASIRNSVALVFDTHNNQGEGSSSVRVETNGLTSPAGALNTALFSTGSQIDLKSGHHFQAHITYTPGQIFLTLKDFETGSTAKIPFNADLFGALGDTVGYVGFTSASGATPSMVNVLNWIYDGQPCCATTPITDVLPSFPNGFTGSASSLQLNKGAAVVGSSLQLTNNTSFEATSAYFKSRANPRYWVTDFDFTIQGTGGDGFTFLLQNDSPYAVGTSGGALGYGPNYLGEAGYSIGNSLAIKFDLHNNGGEGPNSTGLYLNGAYPSIPAVDLTPSGINLHSGHRFHARIVYLHGAVKLSVTDLDTYAVFDSFTETATTLSPAYVGFTAGTGATSNTINILNWTFSYYDVDE